MRPYRLFMLISLAAAAVPVCAQGEYVSSAQQMHSMRGGQSTIRTSAAVPSFYQVQGNMGNRSIIIPSPGSPSPNLVSTAFKETGPVLVEKDVSPVLIEKGTGDYSKRRGKPLLYGLRSLAPKSQALIQESRPEDLGKKKTNSRLEDGGADGPMSMISGKTSTAPGTADKEFSAARVNAVAFGPDVEKADPNKIYVSPTNDNTVLGTAHFHRFMGNNFRADSRWHDAIAEYDLVLAECPGDDLIRAYRAEAKWMVGQRKSAEQDYVALRRSSNAEVRFIRANWLRETGKTDDAIAEYKVSIGKSPTDKAWNNLGVALMSKGDTANATDALSNSLTINPKYDKALLNMGILNDDMLGNSQAAISYYEQYLDLEKGVRRGEVSRWLNEAKKQEKE